MDISSSHRVTLIVSFYLQEKASFFALSGIGRVFFGARGARERGEDDGRARAGVRRVRRLRE